MSLERQTLETQSEFGKILDQKLTAFKVPQVLWAYIFRDEAREAYHQTLWDMVGDVKKDEGAANPEIWSGEFMHLQHAYQTDKGMVVVRQHLPEEPRVATPKDFMITYTNLADTTTQRLYAIGYKQTSEMRFGTRFITDTYMFSDSPADPYVSVEEGIQQGLPYLVVDSPTKGHCLPGAISFDGRNEEQLTSSITDLPTRAWQFGNYYKPGEVAVLAGLYIEASPAQPKLEPVPKASELATIPA